MSFTSPWIPPEDPKEVELVEALAPAGKGDYVVAPGDCMASIADAHGFFWETLWEHPDNQDLRQLRGDPNVLLPGDRVTIPPLRPRQESRAMDARHRFRRRGIPEKLRIEFLDDEGQPRAGLGYVLRIAGLEREGVLDDQGFLEEWIPATATRATLELIDLTDLTDLIGERGSEVYDLLIGELEPAESVNGAAARMAALGWYADGQEFELALEEFQDAHELEPSGLLDEATCAKLRELYGS